MEHNGGRVAVVQIRASLVPAVAHADVRALFPIPPFTKAHHSGHRAFSSADHIAIGVSSADHRAVFVLDGIAGARQNQSLMRNAGRLRRFGSRRAYCHRALMVFEGMTTHFADDISLVFHS